VGECAAGLCRPPSIISAALRTHLSTLVHLELTWGDYFLILVRIIVQMEVSEPPTKCRKTTPHAGHKSVTKASLAQTQQDASTLPAYIYRDLKKENEIRIFKVEKTGPQQWQYDIEHTTLTDAPPFETVSYVWGPDTRQNIIRLRGGRTIRVNDNLAKALPYLSAECKTGYLWIDQININQSSTQERNHQVKMMGDIYRKGERVLAWLGIGSKLAKSTINLIEMVRYLLEVRGSNFAFRENIERYALQNGLEDLMAILQLLDSEWFSRAWVFQEIVLSRHALFIFGGVTLPFLVLFLICQVAVSNQPYSVTDEQRRLSLPSRLYPGLPSVTPHPTILRAYHSLSIMHRSWRTEHNDGGGNGEAMPLTWVLSAVSPLLRTTDPRDSVNAFLGLQHFRDGSVSVKPDYDSTYEQTLVRTAIAIIRDSLSLEILAYCDREKSDQRLLEPLPSWVPEWKATVTTPLLVRWSGDFYRPIQRHSWLESQNPFELKVKAICLDTISTAFAPGFRYQSDDWRKESLENYLALDERLSEVQRHIPCSRERLLGVVLTQQHRPDFARGTWGQWDEFSAKELLETYDRYTGDHGKRRVTVDDNNFQKLRNQTYLVNNKLLFLTKDGYLGCVKQPLMGDKICTIKGCPGFITLRPYRGDRFTVVGICSIESQFWEAHSDQFTQCGFLHSLWRHNEGEEYTLV